ncbi:DinB family protein [Mucilaginibacter mali]|uniref:DinB family protein n=1 Tax=Mucilaginibacter mali TaxID=2740462 RepID=A0A7D4TX06_9SPHI|nr:DinB family protein [Mucilaginibacter mali]QKJ30017.1 DinB family protein [Mucilaginibacter mali]
MISYFKTLFNYDRHTNLLMVDQILAAGISFGQPVVLMGHLLGAQQTWLKRVTNSPIPSGPIWPEDWPAESLKEIIEQNHKAWITHLDSLQEGDIDTIIHYQNLRGDSFSEPHRDIIAHVVNHGTHHRAQIGFLLKSAGVATLPPTDYIFYVRGL